MAGGIAGRYRPVVNGATARFPRKLAIHPCRLSLLERAWPISAGHTPWWECARGMHDRKRSVREIFG